jgi:general secretion pathway protein J
MNARPRPTPTPTRPPRGFTLIELLVALFALALMSGMAWQGVDLVARSREQVQGRMDALLRLQATVAQWEADLNAVIDTQQVPGLAFDGATLRLTRRQDEGVQVVAWTLRGQRLQRWAAAPVRSAERLQDLWLQTYQLLGNEPDLLTLVEPVTGWQLYTFHSSSNAWSNAQSSGDAKAEAQVGDAPPPVGTGASAAGAGGGAAKAAAVGGREQLPDGVRMVLAFAPGAAHAGTLVREIRLIHP